MGLFSKLNKARFDYRTDDWDFKDESIWRSLEDLYKEYGEYHVFQIKGAFIKDQTEQKKAGKAFNDKAPVVIIEDHPVNIPQHQLKDVEEMLNTPEMVEAINNGEGGFMIRTYIAKDYGNKVCYAATWVDYESGDEV